jgi:hypothetical protein
VEGIAYTYLQKLHSENSSFLVKYCQTFDRGLPLTEIAPEIALLALVLAVMLIVVPTSVKLRMLGSTIEDDIAKVSGTQSNLSRVFICHAWVGALLSKSLTLTRVTHEYHT